MNVALDAAPYIDRVPTDANPADEPSKGIFAELDAQGAVYLPAVFPPFLSDKLEEWEHLVGPWAASCGKAAAQPNDPAHPQLTVHATERDALAPFEVVGA